MFNQQPNKQQALQSIQQARNIVNQLRQAESQNANRAKQLSDMEASNELILPGMAKREGQTADQLRNFANVERNAARQLEQLNQILSQLESQLSI
ncbi:MAG: hypothetical protein GX994_06975 [Firmicutes bacterium]|nr:hypothetical protein [Bacillota bacterium]